MSEVAYNCGRLLPPDGVGKPGMELTRRVAISLVSEPLHIHTQWFGGGDYVPSMSYRFLNERFPCLCLWSC